MPDLPVPVPASLVIFDLDGTLIDSRHIMTSSFRTAYAQTVGPGEAPVEAFLGLLGQPFPDILDQLELPATMYDVFRSLSSARVADVVVIPDALAACYLLREAGADCALITGKDRRRTEEILDHHGLRGLFSCVVAGDDEVAGKPAPDGIVAICKRLEVDPICTVVVGDSWVDIAAGAAAGTRTAACGWGIGLMAELRAADPDVYIPEPAGLFSEVHALLAAMDR